MWDSCQDIWAQKFESKVGHYLLIIWYLLVNLKVMRTIIEDTNSEQDFKVNLKVMRTILEDKNSEHYFKVFKTLAARDSSSLNIISSVHTSNLSDFSSESETEIWVSATASYRLGWDVPSAYEKS